MIIFCTTCKGRTQHLEQTLPRNLADNADFADCKFLVLNYNSQDHLMDYLGTLKGPLESGRLVVYSYFEWPSFRMAHAKNLAHRLGILEGGDILVNLDADNFTGPGFAGYVAEVLKDTNVFLRASMVKDGPNRLPRGINGRIAVTKDQFLKVGGYDERFVTWSKDDKDFDKRLRNLGYDAREIDRCYLSGLPHSEKMRYREYPHARPKDGQDDEDEELIGCRHTVVNYGNFGCGTVYRWGSLSPVQMTPVPTRVFGIGLHKTGTTSLHTAFGVLGLDSWHWKNAHSAKSIWREMKEQGRSLTLEKHYALCDLPIPLLYRELDKSYPGSKFILTTRNEFKWLESVRNHWDPARNKFRAAWDTDPFSHKVHRELYGMKNFDAEVFVERFRRHNAEVAGYFYHRPHDLLTMDLDNRTDWQGLCDFLDKPVPNVPYPKKYQTSQVI